jgi:hypothetical protein
LFYNVAMMSETFFYPDGNDWIPTENTRGPWSNDHQHGGPPAALLGRALELFPSEVPMAVTRVTFDLARPVPIRPLRIQVSAMRASKRVQLIHAVLSHEGTELMTAQALRIRREPVVPENTVADETTDPARLAETPFPFFLAEKGYHTSMDLRIERGGFGAGFAKAWMRPRLPLVPDEILTPLQRALLCADSGNGVSAALDKSKFTFINPDLTVSLYREPRGEWICLDAATRLGGDGRGLAVTDLRDTSGSFGTGTQSLLIGKA